MELFTSWRITATTRGASPYATVEPRYLVRLRLHSRDRDRVDESLIREAADGRPARAVKAIALEARLRAEPQLRADTFVQRWQALDRQRRTLLCDREDSRAGKVADTMVGMAKSLERDPQVESLFRNHKTDLRLPDMPTRSIGQRLADVAGRGCSRGLGIQMG